MACSNDRGTVAMARTNVVDSATSQFFINLKRQRFPRTTRAASNFGYAVFGKVVEGMDTIDRIAKERTGNRNGHGDVPATDVVIDVGQARRSREASASHGRQARPVAALCCASRAVGRAGRRCCCPMLAVAAVALGESLDQRLHAWGRGSTSWFDDDARPLNLRHEWRDYNADLARTAAGRGGIRRPALPRTPAASTSSRSRRHWMMPSAAAARAAPAPSRSRWPRTCSCGMAAAGCARAWKPGSRC